MKFIKENQISKEIKNKLSYSGKCDDYDDHGELISSLFSNATEMAQCTNSDNEEVFSLTKSQFLEFLLKNEEDIRLGHQYQINLYKNIAWIYNEDEDVHYFYSL